MKSDVPGPLLETRELVKNYGGVRALKGVSVQIETGTVHGLLGENGAGKSTLVKIVAGLVPPSAGEIRLAGVAVGATDVRGMERRGVFLVPQEPMIVGELSVADNLVLGRWPTGHFGIDDRLMQRTAYEVLAGTGIDPRQLARRLSPVDQRKLNILRALHSGGRLIILDEPTAALTISDRTQLFAFIRRLKVEGATFLFISHYNEEILEICDAVSVLRDGELTASNQPVSSLTSDSLSELVLGRDLALFHRTVARPSLGVGWEVVSVHRRGLNVPRLTIAPGQIVAFVGLPGSGARELGQALYGLLPGCRGRIRHGTAALPLPVGPAGALAHGIAFLSEDRLKDGAVAIQSIYDNICLSSFKKLARYGWISRTRADALVAKFFEALSIKADSAASRVHALSGGNQQKVCLSRLLATEPQLLILNEPTRGIDVGVREEVHRLIDSLTDTGVSITVISSDLDEVLRVSDRVVMFADGKIVADRRADELTKEDVLAVAFTSQHARPAGFGLAQEFADAADGRTN